MVYGGSEMKTAQIECSNPKCKKIFEVPYFRRKQKYCCKGCASSVRMSEFNKTPEQRERAHLKMIRLNKEHENDLLFRENCRKAASSSLKERWCDPDYRKEQTTRSRERMKENWKNLEFGQARAQDLVNYNKSPENAQKSRDRFNEMWKDEKFRGLRRELGRKQFKERNKLDNYNYPKAQKLLFDSLLPFIPDLIWEYEFALKTYIDGFYFLRRRLDITYLPLKIDIEVDGWSHEEESDAARDKALVSAGWTVIRIKNEDVFNNKKKVIHKVLNIVYEKENKETSEDNL
jgi:hypothetical protein